MKRALFALITLTTAAFAAERPGVMFLENTDDYHMEPTGGNFAGQPVTKWGLDFPGRKFASASVTLKLEGGASSVHKETGAKLSGKYGPPTTVITHSDPNWCGTGQTITKARAPFAFKRP